MIAASPAPMMPTINTSGERFRDRPTGPGGGGGMAGAPYGFGYGFAPGGGPWRGRPTPGGGVAAPKGGGGGTAAAGPSAPHAPQNWPQTAAPHWSQNFGIARALSRLFLMIGLERGGLERAVSRSSSAHNDRNSTGRCQ